MKYANTTLTQIANELANGIVRKLYQAGLRPNVCDDAEILATHIWSYVVEADIRRNLEKVEHR